MCDHVAEEMSCQAMKLQWNSPAWFELGLSSKLINQWICLINESFGGYVDTELAQIDTIYLHEFVLPFQFWRR